MRLSGCTMAKVLVECAHGQLNDCSACYALRKRGVCKLCVRPARGHYTGLCGWHQVKKKLWRTL